MTNYEKYQKEIIEILKSGHFVAIEGGKPVSCGYAACSKCMLVGSNCKKKLAEWLESEYVEPPVDWSKVPVDTKVLVSNDGVIWYKRHFARYEDCVCCWDAGMTSFSDDGIDSVAHWKYAKLYEEGEEE